MSENDDLNSPMQLLDKNIPFNEKKVQLLDRIIEETMSSQKSSEELALALKVLAELQNNTPDAWTYVGTIMQLTCSSNTIFFALQILESAIQTRWEILPEAERSGIQSFITDLIIKNCNTDIKKVDNYCLNKLNKVLIQIVKKELPDRCQDFITDLCASALTSHALCYNNLSILKILAEEVFLNNNSDLKSSKKNLIVKQLKSQFHKIFNLCYQILESYVNASDFSINGDKNTITIPQKVIVNNLQCLQVYIRFIPESYIFESNLLNILIDHFWEPLQFRCLAVKCLIEVISLPVGSEMNLNYNQYIYNFINIDDDIKEKTYKYIMNNKMNNMFDTDEYTIGEKLEANYLKFTDGIFERVLNSKSIIDYAKEDNVYSNNLNIMNSSEKLKNEQFNQIHAYIDSKTKQCMKITNEIPLLYLNKLRELWYKMCSKILSIQSNCIRYVSNTKNLEYTLHTDAFELFTAYGNTSNHLYLQNCNNRDQYELFFQHLALCITTFYRHRKITVIEHHDSTHGDTLSIQILMFLSYISEINCEETFEICIEFWVHFLIDLLLELHERYFSYYFSNNNILNLNANQGNNNMVLSSNSQRNNNMVLSSNSQRNNNMVLSSNNQGNNNMVLSSNNQGNNNMLSSNNQGNNNMLSSNNQGNNNMLSSNNVMDKNKILKSILHMMEPKHICKRISHYELVLQRCREICIIRMVKPKEIYIHFDEETGEIEQNTTEIVEVSLYTNMKTCLQILTLADQEKMENTMALFLSEEKVKSSTASNDMYQNDCISWNPLKLNRLCYSVAAISGVLKQESETPFIVEIIKSLLQLVELKRNFEHKAIVATNIMHVVGQYNRFLQHHWKFLKTLILKLFQFMSENSHAVQLMACETYLKVSVSCKKQLADPSYRILLNNRIDNQNTDQFYAKELIENSIEKCNTFKDMKLKLLLYEANAHIISACNADNQNMYIKLLLQPYDHVWVKVLDIIQNNKMNDLLISENINIIIEALRIHQRVCRAAAVPYFSLLKDFTNLFQYLYLLLSKLIMTIYDSFTFNSIADVNSNMNNYMVGNKNETCENNIYKVTIYLDDKEYEKYINDTNYNNFSRRIKRNDINLVVKCKRTILLILETYIDAMYVKAYNSTSIDNVEHILMDNLFNNENGILNQLLQISLSDYKNSPDCSKEYYILILLRTLIRRLGNSMEPGLVKIFHYVILTSMNMIKMDFHSFPEQREAIFDLLCDCTRYCFNGMFLIGAENLQAYMNCIIWAMKHEHPNISEKGLLILYDFFSKIFKYKKDTLNNFAEVFYFVLLQEIFSVFTDSLHKSGFYYQTLILLPLIRMIEYKYVYNETCGLTKDSICKNLQELLCISFPTVNEKIAETFLLNLFTSCRVDVNQDPAVLPPIVYTYAADTLGSDISGVITSNEMNSNCTLPLDVCLGVLPESIPQNIINFQQTICDFLIQIKQFSKNDDPNVEMERQHALNTSINT